MFTAQIDDRGKIDDVTVHAEHRVNHHQRAPATGLLQLFGEPYWIDRSDGEVILFYEYAWGSLELQFEFPEATSLRFITVAVEGILSTKKQRDRYGVTKPWPPELSKP